MGEVVPGECVKNTLPTDDHSGTLSSLGFHPMWKVLWKVVTAQHTVEGEVAAAELLIE